MHLCLHICECALDYGLLYSFWCYSFERMNGLLGNINIMEKVGTGSEPFLGTFMKPMKKVVDLPTEVLELLVKYYCNAYEYAFATVSNIHTSSEDSIVILSKVNQFSRLKVGAEVFGSTHSPRYIKSANVLSQFIIDNNTTDIYPGQVQFFFEIRYNCR